MHKIFISNFFLFILLNVSAQNFKNNQTWFSFGVKAGINIADVKAKISGTTISPNSLTRLTGGFYFSFKTNHNLVIQPEIIYSGQGFKVNNSLDSAGNSAVAKAKFDYLVIPVLFKVAVPNTNGLSVYAGPQLSVLLGAKTKVGSDPQQDVKNQLSSTDIGGLIGVDYSFEKKYNISVRYVFGFSNINTGGSSSSGGIVKNTGFAITLGYMFK